MCEASKIRSVAGGYKQWKTKALKSMNNERFNFKEVRNNCKQINFNYLEKFLP